MGRHLDIVLQVAGLFVIPNDECVAVLHLLSVEDDNRKIALSFVSSTHKLLSVINLYIGVCLILMLASRSRTFACPRNVVLPDGCFVRPLLGS